MNLNNKVAIVTGSSKGVGRVIAEQLLSKGAHVIGWSRSETTINHPNFKGDCLDVGNEEQVIAHFKEVMRIHNTIDIVINNAGFGTYRKIEETDSAVLQQMFDTNVLAIFYLTKLVVPVMKKLQQGYIINISSIAGVTGIENMSAYNATKFAVKGMSESLYKELRKDGIKVTCILPGSIETGFFDEFEEFTSNNKLDPKDVSDSIIYCLESAPSFHPVNFEIRPFNSSVK